MNTEWQNRDAGLYFDVLARLKFAKADGNWFSVTARSGPAKRHQTS